MSTAPLPVVQSIPHGGLAVPEEVDGRLAISDVTIYNECDLWVDQLFDFDHADLATLRPQGQAPATLGKAHLPIARVLIDGNRPPDSLDNPDGVVKTQTSYGDPIYRDPIDRAMQVQLRDRYWQPFHDEVDTLLRANAGRTLLFLDCHNMAQRGPTAYLDPGKVRPAICIANFGDANGEATGDRPLSAPAWFAREAERIAQSLFADLPLLEPNPEPTPVAALNLPYGGGYILHKYVDDAYQRALGVDQRYVGLMVEMNRGLFVGNQRTDTPISPPNQARIAAVRLRLYKWLTAVVALLEERAAQGDIWAGDAA
ncbi:MAG: N-formylglutamate amidohydrolase [Caldilineaceae bacterium]|nr:N-formylglutamate amidohydrolase [Caldilineaceae bacterium]